MTWYVVKFVISAALIVLISEIARRYSLVGGLIASLPIVSYLGMIWLYVDTQDSQKVADLSASIFWLVLPSLVLFVLLPVMLRAGVNFYLSLAVSTAAMFIAYALMMLVLRQFGWQ